ncbi:hypothetical protein MAQ5080_03009 [Marinomonas aquimarina]|uniref:Uncharacterized protein n=1 Tax=Marinomonas aquimarina TaxID=295068 RepID=A0A1A8TQ37_9GAMM|nr:hypothetical protein [Marinomonas aquimarina]SBS34899.1 hypothetical protein MAQ5080_03009 [Marinomonas aquimarina]
MGFAKASLNIKTLGGYGVALGCGLFLLALLPGFNSLTVLSAWAYWLVCIGSWPRINGRNKRQIAFLIGGGLVALAVALKTNVEIPYLHLLEGNLAIVAMLSAVSFLGLLPDTVKQSRAIQGGKGVLSTWASVHLLGSVINMSAVFVVGDKLQRLSKELSTAQFSVLIRALTSAAWWSPFFGSMAVALSIAPQAEFHHLAMIGVPIALLACLVSVWEFKRNGSMIQFVGFPLALNALIFPATLALLVLVVHYFIFPSMAILAVVTLLSPLSVVVLLLLRYGPRHTKQRLSEHAHIRLANMGNELSLFLAAGFLSTTVSLALKGVLGEGWSLFAHFGFLEAYLCFLAICGIALLGLHPIVGISLMSSMVPFDDANNTLLAFVALCAWAVGTTISPLSGINLSVAGKYTVDNFKLAKANLLYGAIMSLCVALGMWLLSWSLQA